MCISIIDFRFKHRMLITKEILNAAVRSLFGGRIRIHLSLSSCPADSSIFNQLPSFQICLLPDHSSPLYSQISLAWIESVIKGFDLLFMLADKAALCFEYSM